MAFGNPTAMSLVGDASFVRYLHRPLAGKSTAVWAAQGQPGLFRFVLRDITGVITQPYAGTANFFLDGADFTDIVVPLDIRNLTGFHVSVRTDGVLGFVYSDGDSRTWRFRFNPTTKTVVGALEQVFTGDQPALVPTVVGTPRLHTFYLEKDGIFRRTSSDEGGTWSTPPRTAIQPSSSRVETFDVDPKAAVTAAHYVGDHLKGPGLLGGIALPMSADGNTRLLLNTGVTEVANTTEAMPSGAVSYWTMDTAQMSGSSLLDQVGSNTLTTAGTNLAFPGQVGGSAGARFFNGSTSWTVASNAGLQLVGNLTLEWWQYTFALGTQRSIIHKASAGEFSVVLETDGTMSFTHGTSGTNSGTQQTFSMPVPVITGRWHHMCVVRDQTNRTLRWFRDGVLVAQDVVQLTPVAGSLALFLGQGNASMWFGALDQVAVFNIALSAEQARNEYEKGLADKRLDQSHSSQLLRIPGSGGIKAYPSGDAVVVPGRSGNALSFGRAGLVFVGPGTYANLNGLVGFTVECWVRPTGAQVHWPRGAPVAGQRVMDSFLAGSLSAGSSPPAWRLGYFPDGKAFFQFSTGGGTNPLLVQTAGQRVRRDRFNYLAVSHVFLDGSAQTFLMVNGAVVTARWVYGTGNESVSGGLSTGMAIPLSGDTLDSVRVSAVARTSPQLASYFQGVAT